MAEPVFSICCLTDSNNSLIPVIPAHFGVLTFDSPSIVSLKNFRKEHSVSDIPTKIILDSANP